MAYEFDRFLSSQRAKNSGGGETADKQIIYGEDIQVNPVPERTALENNGKLRVQFEDPWGRKFAMSEQLLSKHLLLLGGIGSGKTNVFSILTQNLLNRQTPDDIIFIFDTKGDFYDTFYQPYNPCHIVVGNSRMYHAQSRCWNIFGELDMGEAFSAHGEFTAKEISKQLFEGRGSETQPFFPLAAADLVAKVLIDFERQAQRDHDRSRLNNQALAAWLCRANLESYTEMIERNPDFASAQFYFGDPSQGAQQNLTAQALGVFGYINAMCSDLFTGIFAQTRPGSEFSMGPLVRNRGKNGGKTVVFIEYDLSAGEVLGPIYRLLIDLALKEALGQSGRRRGNVIFLIDEFKLLPRLNHIDDALNFGRSLGVKVFAGLQSIDQLYAGYGEARGKCILSGFMNSFCFQTPDYNSRQYISQRFGQNCCQLTYRSLNQSVSFQRAGHVIEDWDILKLEPGQAAVDIVGERPFLFQFQEFKKRLH